MKTPQMLFALFAVQLFTWAADVTGPWKAEFNTQIGVQKYQFTFQQQGNTLTGKAIAEIGGEKHESKLKNGKVEGDTVSFVEELNFQGNSLEIRYDGKLSGKEISFTRKVGDLANEEFVAKLDAPAIDIAGQWQAEFDTPVGLQKYQFDFQVAAGKVVAKGSAETGADKRVIEFNEAKLAGDIVTFTEMRRFRTAKSSSNTPAKWAKRESSLREKWANWALSNRWPLGLRLLQNQPCNRATHRGVGVAVLEDRSS